MDNYLLVERLGQGSFAVVWKARRKTDQRLVAVKQLKQAPTTWEECKRLPEIRAAAAIRGCLHIIALLEAVRHGTELLLVLEYADTDLCRCLGPGKRFEEPQVRWAMRQLMSALAAVHAAGFVHCDVKPENLLLFARGGPGNSPVLKLCDLGQAAASGEVESYVGTRWYRAPELLLGYGRAGEEVDLWAAGCAMAELLLLRPVFPGNDTRDMLFRICSALGAPEEGWRLSEQLMEASGLRFAPCAAEGPVWFEIAANGASPPAVELVRGLLRYVQERRLSAARALQAHFFSPSAPEAPILPPDSDKARAQRGEQMQRNRDEAKAVERKLHAARGGGAEGPPPSGGCGGGCWGAGLGGLSAASRLCGGASGAGATTFGIGIPAANGSSGTTAAEPASPHRWVEPRQMQGGGGFVQGGGLRRRHDSHPQLLQGPHPPHAVGDRRVAFGHTDVAPVQTNPQPHAGAAHAAHVVGPPHIAGAGDRRVAFGHTDVTLAQANETPPGYGNVRSVGLPRPSSSKTLCTGAESNATPSNAARLRGKTASCSSLTTGAPSGSAAPSRTNVTRALRAAERGIAGDGPGDSDDEELAQLFWNQVESSRHALRSGPPGPGIASTLRPSTRAAGNLSPSPPTPSQLGYGGLPFAPRAATTLADGEGIGPLREDGLLPSAGVRLGVRRLGERSGSAWENEGSRSLMTEAQFAGGGAAPVAAASSAPAIGSRMLLVSDAEQDEWGDQD